MEQETEILKTDVLGRVTLPPQKREAILDEFEKSGVPASKFCKHYGIGQQTFSTWVQKRRRCRGELPARKSSRSKKQLELVEAVVEHKPQGIKLELSNGTKVEISNRSQLALAVELISLLGK